MADRIITVIDPSVVTNDTLAGYNNYSDIDGQLGTTMTPTEATNGKTVALSDGVVHEVTTKPVGTTNGEFSAVVSIAVTVDLSGGELSLTNLTYDGVTHSAALANPNGIAFNPDGTIMYQLGNSGEVIRQATLDAPYDITFAGVYTSTVLQGNTGTPYGLVWNPNGLEFLFIDQGLKKIIKNTVSVAWDSTSISGSSVSTLVLANFTSGIAVSADGTKVFTTRGVTVNDVREYTLSTPWDVTTDTLTHTVDLSGSLSGATRDVYITDDGMKLIVGDNVSVGEFALATPNDLTTIGAALNVKDVTAQETSPRSFTFKPDYTKMYIAGDGDGGDIFQYSL